MIGSDADIIIIGSGFGGSVAAMRAAESGLRTLVIERGRRLDESSRIEREDVYLSKHSNGPAQIHAGRGLLALTGNALGGGSQIYTAVKMPPRPEIFETDWPEGVSLESLAPYYQKVRDVIQPRFAEGCDDRMRKLEVVAKAVNGKAVALPLAWEKPKNGMLKTQTTGILGQWRAWRFGGGKRPLTKTYLAEAENRGAKFRCESEAVGVRPTRGGYRVDVERRTDGGIIHESVAAPHVVIAAGTLNTLRLLFRCRDYVRCLPDLGAMLGKRFYTNGDMGAAFFGGAGLPSVDDGPLVSGWVDLWDSERLFVMEIGRFPLTGASERSPWLFGMMGVAPLEGSICFENGRLVHFFDRRPFGEFHTQTMSIVRKMAAALGARSLAVPSTVFNRAPVTVHPLGGARMANVKRDGVVNRFGEVFGYPGLFVLDGAAVPTALGAPPSMTIAALAERAMDAILQGAG